MAITMAAARADGVVLSKDQGQTWWPMGIPTVLTRIHRVAFSPDGTLWLGAREGVYFTRDLGKTWMWLHRLPFRDVDDLTYDAPLRTRSWSVRGTATRSTPSIPRPSTWKWWQTGYRIALVRAAGDRLVAASLDDGVLCRAADAGRCRPQSAGMPAHVDRTMSPACRLPLNHANPVS